MDDLIPFLILVAISIVGAVARKKKRPVDSNVPNRRPEPAQDDFLSWMERIADNRPEPVPFGMNEVEFEEEIVEEPVTVPVVESPVQRPNLFANYSGFISPDEKEQMIRKEAPRSIVKDAKENLSAQTIKDNEIGNEKITVDFDLKKAVIYSELLNRKYS